MRYVKAQFPSSAASVLTPGNVLSLLSPNCRRILVHIISTSDIPSRQLPQNERCNKDRVCLVYDTDFTSYMHYIDNDNMDRSEIYGYEEDEWQNFR